MQQFLPPIERMLLVDVHPKQEIRPYQVVKLNGCNPLVYTRDHLLSDSSSIDMFWIQAIAQPRHSGCDLVELYALLASV